MKVLVIGATGLLGTAAATALDARHEVIQASRSGDVQVDLADAESISAMFESVGKVDAVVACTGVVPFKPLAELTAGDFEAGVADKVLGQVNLVLLGTPYVNDGGSFTLTTGVLAREPINTGVAASLANGALESFVMAAAAELPRGIRINAVSPSVLEDATGYHDFFPGFAKISSEDVGRAYVKSVDGIQNGRVFPLG
ncbi:short chain dehydrogenase [Paenarthrobacter nitroguajacolicus]|uniref:Short chain dehydrogenase n=1 Tax=Paenarthrobacter nitroguajacolicus TaxID=211146 RepID=A0A558GNC3_PAENT|nr:MULTISPECIES: short chain dehydrogenase [Paenarthrobacter]MCM0616865.1 short chain dehydrogenase [Paenarthrobacter sp. TYUT067]TVU58379.1 short chain dehydrogenase [Paenarthrobacter nitroguajacolicus]